MEFDAEKILWKNAIVVWCQLFFACFYFVSLATRIVLDIILFFDRIYRIGFYPVTKYLINKTVQLLTGSRFAHKKQAKKARHQTVLVI